MLLEELCRKKDDNNEVDILLSEMEYENLSDLVFHYSVFSVFLAASCAKISSVNAMLSSCVSNYGPAH